MLVPEQLQGNWRGFVVLTVINHSPELKCLTRTFLEALSLSHPEKQMVSVLPCICRKASQITRGVCSGVCVWKSQPCSAFRFYKNRQESGLHFPWKGKKKKKIHYLLLFGKCKRGRGTRASTAILPLGCTSENIASAEVLKEITCFSTSFGYKFLWNWLESGF